MQVGHLTLFALFIIVMTLFYLVSQQPTCGGTLDPTLRYCNPKTSRLVSGKVIPESECNPISEAEKLAVATEFVDYMKRINESVSNEMALRLQKFFPQAKIYQGSLFFAIPPLLKLLASDFGQNELTPYGIISFSDMYLKSCISNSAEFCRKVAKGNELVSVLCQQYLTHLSKESEGCPFHVTDSNKNLQIQDVGFFNLIGSLGTFSLLPSQCLVVYYDFPVGLLPLNYWSFNLYLADRLEQKTCSPYRQTYLASLTPPLNCFMTPALAGKKFNPITGKGDLVTPSRIRFYMIVSLNESVAQKIVDFIQQTSTSLPYDFIHVFHVPTGPHSMVLDPNLPNPNKIDESRSLYNPETDRLSLFLRLSPDPSKDYEHMLKQYIYSDEPFTKNACEVCLVDLENVIPESKLNLSQTKYQQPTYINPIFNEKANFSSTFHKFISSFSSSLYWNDMSVAKLPLRNSVLNIFAPLFPSILDTSKPYLGGWQAVQLAGCAQGDNPDTQYRLSGSVCLSKNDVMISVAVNHSKFGNCLYNNINVVDINKAYSISSTTLTKEIVDDIYIIVIGRNASLVDHVKNILNDASKRFQTIAQIGIYPITMKTGPSFENGVPMCHQVLMVERVYVNMQYPSTQFEHVEYNLQEVFGEFLQDVLLENENKDSWKSLVNVCAPLVDTLVPPKFYKVSYPSYRKYVVTFSTIFLCILIFVMFFYK